MDVLLPADSLPMDWLMGVSRLLEPIDIEDGNANAFVTKARGSPVSGEAARSRSEMHYGIEATSICAREILLTSDL
jgi:hypothetical protein